MGAGAISARHGWGRLGATLLIATLVLGGCLPRQAPPAPYALFAVADGDVYGPSIAPPISIRLGQSILTAHGPVGPEDRPEGLAAMWEGHAFSLNPDREANRTLFFYVEAENLKQVSLQINGQTEIVERDPGVFVSGEFSMVRWAQDYSLKVTAENAEGDVRRAAIYVQGEDARFEGTTGEPLRMRMLRMGETVERPVRGTGYQGKIYRHPWPVCTEDCDLSTPGGALTAVISGPTDALFLVLDQIYPFVAWGLSYWPSPHYLIVAIPIGGESRVDLAALTRDGSVAMGRWDKPPGPVAQGDAPDLS